ncbi:hypothetical protein I3843_09G062500 [Carya illinoinensis]|uniref:Uncharacterized protein n=1 Tax=Carya illinoinensis TaxID=32201 RepID=A0A922E127_CARIL|nr:hypothetical protein I3760_09G061900 [Carya illinoinensis]KAG6694711.1 hypothetical protein I3842_09G062300 [Carya illinoinensis]KAG7962352.1 hypothetical protein I3843_09G062500 [Carya illinoinensis]
MATHLQNKISVDVAADNGSSDSLSFAGFVSIQDQQSKSPPDISAKQIKKTQKFEFCHTGPGVTATDSIKYSKADLLIPMRSDDREGGMSISDKPNHKVRNKAKKECTAASSSFGLKLFQSFLSPCRQCQADTPTVKARTAPGENLKIH